MKTWNYRLMVDDDGHYSIREVFYDDDKNIEGWTEDCSPFGTDLEEIQQDINWMLLAFQRDILHENDLITSKIDEFKEELGMDNEDNDGEDETNTDTSSDL